MSYKSHVLIIDDIVENIKVAMNILEEESYDLSFATEGMEALSLIVQGPIKFDLILLDIMMPGLDGLEVCKRIKENSQTKDIPIIFLTAKVDVDSISQWFFIRMRRLHN